MKNKISKDEIEEKRKEKVDKRLSKIGRGELVSDKPYKLSRFKKALAIFGWTLLGVAVITPFALVGGTKIASKAKDKNAVDLTADAEDIADFYQELNINSSYDLNQNGQLRRLTAYHGKTIKLNVQIKNLSEQQKQDILQAVSDLNNIFAVVNPNYKFSVDFNPNLIDVLDMINIDLRYMNAIERKEYEDTVSGSYSVNELLSHTNGNGMDFKHSEILIRDGFLNYTTIAHEMLHHLGLSDGYLLEYVDVPSIMNNDKHIRMNDVAMLVAKYGDYSTPEKKASLIEFIKTYEQNQQWFKDKIAIHTETIAEFKQVVTETLKTTDDQIVYDLLGNGYGCGISNSMDTFAQNYSSWSFSTLYSIFYNYTLSLKINDQKGYDAKLYQLENRTAITTVDGIYVNSEDLENLIFYFGFNGEIYSAVKSNDQWDVNTIVRCCTEEEFSKQMSIIEQLKSGDINTLAQQHLDMITSAMVEKNKAPLTDFDIDTLEAKEYKFGTYCTFVVNDNGSISFRQNDGSLKPVSYMKTSFGAIFDNHTILFKTADGELACSRVFYNSKDKKFYMYMQYKLTVVSEYDNELE